MFRSFDIRPKIPRAEKVLSQGSTNIAGKVEVLSEGDYPPALQGSLLKTKRNSRDFC